MNSINDRLMVLLQEHKIVSGEFQWRSKLGIMIIQWYLALIGVIYAAMINVNNWNFLPVIGIIGAGFGALMSTQTYYIGFLRRYLLRMEYNRILGLLEWQEFFLSSTPRTGYKWHKWFSGGVILVVTSIGPSVAICMLAILYWCKVNRIWGLRLNQISVVVWWSKFPWIMLCFGILATIGGAIWLIWRAQRFISPERIREDILGKSTPGKGKQRSYMKD